LKKPTMMEQQSQELHQQHPHQQHVPAQQQQQHQQQHPQQGHGRCRGHGHGRREEQGNTNNTSIVEQNQHEAKENRLLRSQLMQLRLDFSELQETKEAYVKEVTTLRHTQQQGHVHSNNCPGSLNDNDMSSAEDWQTERQELQAQVQFYRKSAQHMEGQLQKYSVLKRIVKDCDSCMRMYDRSCGSAYSSHEGEVKRHSAPTFIRDTRPCMPIFEDPIVQAGLRVQEQQHHHEEQPSAVQGHNKTSSSKNNGANSAQASPSRGDKEKDGEGKGKRLKVGAIKTDVFISRFLKNKKNESSGDDQKVKLGRGNTSPTKRVSSAGITEQLAGGFRKGHAYSKRASATAGHTTAETANKNGSMSMHVRHPSPLQQHATPPPIETLSISSHSRHPSPPPAAMRMRSLDIDENNIPLGFSWEGATENPTAHQRRSRTTSIPRTRRLGQTWQGGHAAPREEVSGALVSSQEEEDSISDDERHHQPYRRRSRLDHHQRHQHHNTNPNTRSFGSTHISEAQYQEHVNSGTGRMVRPAARRPAN
jgi:hypothetical protein